VRLFSKSLRLYPTDVWALNNRGLAYGKLGKREKARRDFQAALRIEPEFEQARRNLKEIQSVLIRRRPPRGSTFCRSPSGTLKNNLKRDVDFGRTLVYLTLCLNGPSAPAARASKKRFA